MTRDSIGVIDSGVGGLTILKSLINEFPNESFVYYGDTKHAPYGEKDIPTLKKLTEKMVRFMEEKQVKILVVACNTITASGVLKEIPTTIPHLIEIIQPTVDYAILHSKSNHFTLLATDVTIKSGMYQTYLRLHMPEASIDTFSLPELVVLAEKADFTSPVAKEAIKNLAKRIPPQSTVILGCTHYPFFTSLFHKYFPADISIIDSSIVISNKLKKYIQEGKTKTTEQKVTYHCSGDKKILNTIVSSYLD